MKNLGENHTYYITAILFEPALAQQCEHNLAFSSWTGK